MVKHLDLLPDYWQSRLVEIGLERSEGKHSTLAATCFNGKVQLQFEDGSFCFFNHAFFLVDDERSELLVLTEHCGYHLYSMNELSFDHLVVAS